MPRLCRCNANKASVYDKLYNPSPSPNQSSKSDAKKARGEKIFSTQMTYLQKFEGLSRVWWTKLEKGNEETDYCSSLTTQNSRQEDWEIIVLCLTCSCLRACSVLLPWPLNPKPVMTFHFSWMAMHLTMPYKGLWHLASTFGNAS